MVDSMPLDRKVVGSNPILAATPGPWASPSLTVYKIYYILYGPSIKNVTLFLANFDPVPLSHFVTHPGTPKVRHTSRTTPIFSRPSTKNSDKSPLYKFSLNCSWGFFSRGFVRGSFVWKVLFVVVFVHSPSVRIHLLQQKGKHHFKFHVSLYYV